MAVSVDANMVHIDCPWDKRRLLDRSRSYAASRQSINVFYIAPFLLRSIIYNAYLFIYQPGIPSNSPSTLAREKCDHYLNFVGVQAAVIVITCCDLVIITFLLLISLEVIQNDAMETKARESVHRRKSSSLVVIVFVFGDVIINTCLILLRYGVIFGPPSSHSTNEGEIQHQQAPSSGVRSAEMALHVIQIIILSVFMVEIVCRVMSKGVEIIYDKWQIFDSIVVLVTFVLYVAFTGAVSDRTLTYSVAYIIAFRLWRIGRLYYDITEPVVRKAQHIIISHRKAMRRSDEVYKKQQHQIMQQQRDIELLKEQIRRLQGKPSPKRNLTETSEQVSSQHKVGEGPSGSVGVSPTHLTKAHSHSGATNKKHSLRPRPSPESNGSLKCGESGNSYADSTGQVSQPGTPVSCVSCPGALDSNNVCVQPSLDGKITAYDSGFTVNKDKEAIYKNKLSKCSSKTLDDLMDSSKISRLPDGAKQVGKLLRSGSSNNVYMERSFMNNDRELEVTVIHRSPSQNDITVGMYEDPQIVGSAGDKRNLINDLGGQLNRDMSYSNPGFAESLTEEELLREIERIAKVPYQAVGSTSVLSKEGIPMTDL